MTVLLWSVFMYEKMVKRLSVSASSFAQVNSEFIKVDWFKGAGEHLTRGCGCYSDVEAGLAAGNLLV
jgi:hypothetical protein